MAGTAAADELNDRERFRGFYRTEVSTRNIGPALAEMARQFDWMQMAIITEDQSLFKKVCL
jgi:ABC-type branched-subunit amino acid transport system substrate-binding protein